MTGPPPAPARSSPSTARNRDPILRVLKGCLPATGFVLEIAAGAGEHALYNAAACPGLLWQPTDSDPEALASIAAWRDHAGTPNLLAPLALDAARPETWPIKAADAIVNINMIHISPWDACRGLMRGAGDLLPPGGVLFLYGPYKTNGQWRSPNDPAFDQSLKQRDPSWGLRDLETVVAEAGANGLVLVRTVDMPAGNLSVVFCKS